MFSKKGKRRFHERDPTKSALEKLSKALSKMNGNNPIDLS
jgi:hypothetical protein